MRDQTARGGGGWVVVCLVLVKGPEEHQGEHYLGRELALDDSLINLLPLLLLVHNGHVMKALEIREEPDRGTRNDKLIAERRRDGRHCVTVSLSVLVHVCERETGREQFLRWSRPRL